jgi:hypothetical protein
MLVLFMALNAVLATGCSDPALGDANARRAGPIAIPIGSEVLDAVRERNRVYVAAGAGGLHVVDLTSRRSIVQRVLPEEAITRVALVDGVLLASGEGPKGVRLHRLFAKDLSVDRSIDLGDLGRVSALKAISPEHAAVISGGAIALVMTTSGSVRRLTLDDGIATGAAVIDGRLVVTSRYPGALVMVDPDTAKAETIATEEWLDAVLPAGNGAAWLMTPNGPRRFDLTSRRFVTPPGALRAARGLGRIRADGGLDVLGDGGLVTLSAAGVVERVEALPTAVPGARLIDVGGGDALVSAGDQLIWWARPGGM